MTTVTIKGKNYNVTKLIRSVNNYFKQFNVKYKLTQIGSSWAGSNVTIILDVYESSKELLKLFGDNTSCVEIVEETLDAILIYKSDIGTFSFCLSVREFPLDTDYDSFEDSESYQMRMQEAGVLL